MDKKLPVTEMFGPTIQGEGPMVGRRTLFVRLAGCDYRCSWCDSKHTWQPPIVKELATVEEIGQWMTRKRVQTGVGTVVISGGNPALHDLGELVERLRFGGIDGYPWNVALETQGTRHGDWFDWINWLVISPKGPSSGMTTDYVKLNNCIRAGRIGDVYLKVVIFSDADYEYAKDINHRWPTIPMYLSVGTYAPERGFEGQSVEPVGIERVPRRDAQGTIILRTTELAEKVMQDSGWINDPCVLPQVHVLLWGFKRGV